MPRTWAGTCLAENSGASTNSGLTRASTRKNAVIVWPPPSADSTWLSVELVHPTSDGIDMYRFWA